MIKKSLEFYIVFLLFYGNLTKSIKIKDFQVNKVTNLSN